mmetsp:Transcript_15926/g.28565  ORF Transcript_15926/g.28565 Transcript_15926/m.28565 type:complete len:89 (+) Transcript_15926:26-292(+)
MASVYSSDAKYKQTLCVRFPTEGNADIVYKTLSVDEEFRPDRIYRQIQCKSDTITIMFASHELRYLRVCVSSFLQSMALVVDTLEAFK